MCPRKKVCRFIGWLFSGSHLWTSTPQRFRTSLRHTQTLLIPLLLPFDWHGDTLQKQLNEKRQRNCVEIRELVSKEGDTCRIFFFSTELADVIVTFSLRCVCTFSSSSFFTAVGNITLTRTFIDFENNQKAVRTRSLFDRPCDNDCVKVIFNRIKGLKMFWIAS